MSAQNTLAFDIRKWEVQTMPKFHSIKGAGGNWVEIKMPANFVYGSFVHLRDLVFLYGNLYDVLQFQYLDVFAGKEQTVKVTLNLTETGAGKAAFLDEVMRPIFNHKYYYRIVDLPFIPEELGLFHKLHFRVITKQGMASEGKSNEDFFMGRIINRPKASDYWQILDAPRIPYTEPLPIQKYVCYVCKKMYGLKQLYTFMLEGKKHHICHGCYDDIPMTTMDKITLKKV